MGLREENAAHIKVDILNATLKAATQTGFKSTLVQDLCSEVGISKVTFFKYFPQKEDVLLYYLRVWCLEATLELKNKEHEGVDAIYYLFKKMAVSCKKRPEFMLGLVGYLSSISDNSKPFPFNKLERQMIFLDQPEIVHIEMQSIHQLFEKHLLHAILNNVITKTSNVKQLVNLFTSLLFGTVLTARIQGVRQISVVFKTNLDLMFRGLA